GELRRPPDRSRARRAGAAGSRPEREVVPGHRRLRIPGHRLDRIRFGLHAAARAPGRRAAGAAVAGHAAGLSADVPRPTGITLHRASHVLEVEFEDGATFRLPCEYLRAHSPSAEVQGHGPGQRVLQHGKRHVNIDEIVPVGHYGVLLKFDDGHDTGIYSWAVLHDLGVHQAQNWQAYLEALRGAGLGR